MKTFFNQLLLFQLVREQALDEEHGLKCLIDSKYFPNFNSVRFVRSMKRTLESINSTDAQEQSSNEKNENMQAILSFKEKHHELFKISYKEVKEMLDNIKKKLARSDYRDALKLIFNAWDSLADEEKAKEEKKERFVSSSQLEFSSDNRHGHREFCYSFIGIKRSLTETGCKRLFDDQINSKEFKFFSVFFKIWSQKVQKKENVSNP